MKRPAFHNLSLPPGRASFSSLRAFLRVGGGAWRGQISQYAREAEHHALPHHVSSERGRDKMHSITRAHVRGATKLVRSIGHLLSPSPAAIDSVSGSAPSSRAIDTIWVETLLPANRIGICCGAPAPAILQTVKGELFRELATIGAKM
jgi:hypothetical protein